MKRFYLFAAMPLFAVFTPLASASLVDTLPTVDAYNIQLDIGNQLVPSSAVQPVPPASVALERTPRLNIYCDYGFHAPPAISATPPWYRGGMPSRTG